MSRVDSFSMHRLLDARTAGCEAVRGKHRPVIGALLVMMMVMVVVLVVVMLRNFNSSCHWNFKLDLHNKMFKS